MISGVVVASRPEHLAVVTEAVAAFPWADVHYSDPAGRLVVTIEAHGMDDSISRFEALQKLPNVLSASLAEYRLEGHETEMQPPTADAAATRSILKAVRSPAQGLRKPI